MKLIVCHFLVTSLVYVLLSTRALAAANGTVEGFEKDAQTGDPLPGSNVMRMRTGLGASTDLNGKCVIHDVPPGSHTLRATYIGYLQRESSMGGS